MTEEWEDRWAPAYKHGPVKIVMAKGRRLRKPRIVQADVQDSERSMLGMAVIKRLQAASRQQADTPGKEGYALVQNPQRPPTIETTGE